MAVDAWDSEEEGLEDDHFGLEDDTFARSARSESSARTRSACVVGRGASHQRCAPAWRVMPGYGQAMHRAAGPLPAIMPLCRPCNHAGLGRASTRKASCGDEEGVPEAQVNRPRGGRRERGGRRSQKVARMRAIQQARAFRVSPAPVQAVTDANVGGAGGGGRPNQNAALVCVWGNQVLGQPAGQLGSRTVVPRPSPRP